ncbi:hypothetical protein PLESTB_001781000 [Pleodorina starrii]|uniref:Protein FAM221A n=1 Tax=Pleodorina starrii TaxID=330485 RepID=A0A9W6C166_9CHLO|nr:hypothetical protein PLESTM_000804000 [Pleodorina starrii]GLC61597.1 hypothetical protein PLESTB_001781000 [Pleodorina starrii]GLC70223.1 hypothetical protein PLESTF_000940200 [Pleodorina starrii]
MSATINASALANLKARRQHAASSGGPEAGASPPGSETTAAETTATTTPPQTSSSSAAAAAPAAAPPASQSPPLPTAPAEPLPTRDVEAFAWVCGTCQRECVPIRSESRCLCGHRLREHDPASSKAASRCKASKCSCRGFFFIVAEGAWVLRCRCKHKHVEHDPATRSCAKSGCSCRSFDSPWVCNCDHPWSDHKQLVVVKQVVSVRDMLGGMSLAEVGGGGPAREVNDYGALKRGDFGA